MLLFLLHVLSKQLLAKKGKIQFRQGALEPSSGQKYLRSAVVL